MTPCTTLLCMTETAAAPAAPASTAVATKPAADITIKVPKNRFTVDLGGENYTARAPKSTVALTLSKALSGVDVAEEPEKALKVMEDLLKLIMPVEADSKRVIERLRSDDDDLDYPHVMQLVQALVERATGNPTT